VQKNFGLVFSIASSVKKILANKIVSLYLIFFSKIVYLYRFNRYIFEYRCPPLDAWILAQQVITSCSQAPSTTGFRDRDSNYAKSHVEQYSLLEPKVCLYMLRQPEIEINFIGEILQIKKEHYPLLPSALQHFDRILPNVNKIHVLFLFWLKCQIMKYFLQAVVNCCEMFKNNQQSFITENIMKTKACKRTFRKYCEQNGGEQVEYEQVEGQQAEYEQEEVEHDKEEQEECEHEEV
jgi:hypothetical protein